MAFTVINAIGRLRKGKWRSKGAPELRVNCPGSSPGWRSLCCSRAKHVTARVQRSYFDSHYLSEPDDTLGRVAFYFFFLAKG